LKITINSSLIEKNTQQTARNNAEEVQKKRQKIQLALTL